MKMKKKIIENNSKVSCHSSFIWCKRNGTEGLISKYEPTEGSDYLSERQILFGLRTTSQYYSNGLRYYYTFVFPNQISDTRV